MSLVLPWHPVLTATLHLSLSQFSALSFPQRLLQSPLHRCWTPAVEMWSRRRRRRGVQATSTSLQWVSRGRGEKWGIGEWKCDGRGVREGRERERAREREREGLICGRKKVNDRGNGSKREKCMDEYRRNWWKTTLSLAGNKKRLYFSGFLPVLYYKGA